MSLGEDKRFRQKGNIQRKLQGLIHCKLCGRKRYYQIDAAGNSFIKSCQNRPGNECDDRGHKYEPIEEAVLEVIKSYKSQVKKQLLQLKSTDTSTPSVRIDVVENFSV